MSPDIFKRIKSLAKHLLITVGSGITIVLTFFYIYLPVSTNHGETITVPDVRNQPFGELDNILVSRNLRYEINADSGYSAGQAPLTVLNQFPRSNSKVKENRKIYITLNARQVPMVKMPNLMDKSLMIAQVILKSLDLNLGKIKYVPLTGLNTIVTQQYNGEEIPPGGLIPRGSKVDFEVANGDGSTSWIIKRFIDQPLDEAEIAIRGAGLQLGTITYVSNPIAIIKAEFTSESTTDLIMNVPIGHVVKHKPNQGDTVSLLDFVDLWVYQPDSISSDSSILDIQN